MASIWDFLSDDTATTREELFRGIAPEPEEEETIFTETIVTPTPAGPVTSAKMPERELTTTEKYLKETVGIESPQSLSFDEQQSAINDFLGERQKENIFASPTEEEKMMEQEGAKFQEEETARGFQAFEEANIRERAIADQEFTQQQAKKSEVDNLLAKMRNQYDVAMADRKFKEVEARRKKSIDSIERSMLSVYTNKATAGTPFGKMKLQNLMAMHQEVNQQANADLEKLGGQAWEQMDPDTKLAYTRVSKNPEVPPQARIQYAEQNNLIKKSAQKLLLNVPDDQKNRIDEILFGKKKVENGQVQYDADNEPIRVTRGLATKNQFGLYEPSVDLDTYTTGLKKLGLQFSPAMAEIEAMTGARTAGAEKAQRLDLAKGAKELFELKNLNIQSEKEEFIKDGGDPEQFSLEAARERGTATEKDINRINELDTQGKEFMRRGYVLTPEERIEVEEEEKQEEQKALERGLNTTLIETELKPTPEKLDQLYKSGKVRTFTVENNKLVESDSGATPQVISDEYVIIDDPEVGGQLVKIGKGNMDKFLEDANKFFYINGKFTQRAPSLTGTIGTATRAAALGIPAIQPIVQAASRTEGLPEADSPFNKNLQTARANKTGLLKAEKRQAAKKKLEGIKR